MSTFLRCIATTIFLFAALNVAVGQTARKGTRNYQTSDGAAMAPGTAGETSKTSNSGTRALDDCMAYWDAGTHMTKDEWRVSCERLISERAQKPGT
jgi:hypothetical protein